MRRSWPQRLLITFNVFAIVASLATAGLVAYGKKTLSDVPRVDLRPNTITPSSELPPGEPENFLVVGNDSADGLPADAPERVGRDAQEGTVRSDVIMVIRIDPKGGEARLLSFPRDLWVDIPGRQPGRINSMITYGEDGGPSLLIETLKANFGIDINHYVEVNWASFKSIIEQIGGVKIYLSHPLRDGKANLWQPNTGCQLLDAGQSLAYVRSRHLQWQNADGKWISDGTSDHGRISRQQQLMKRALEQAINKGARNPATLNRLLTEPDNFPKLDRYTTPQDLLNLGRAFRDFEPEDLGTFSLPVTDIRKGGEAVLQLIDDQAEPILEQFRGTGASGVAADIDPSNATVRVLNGTGGLNEGSITTDALDEVGFQVASPGDAAEHVTRTEVRFPSGQDNAAALVARYLDGEPILVKDDTMGEVTVVTGPDLKGVLSVPLPANTFDIATTTTTSTTSTTTVPGSDGSGASSTTTTTTKPKIESSPVQGYVPGEVPAGVDC